MRMTRDFTATTFVVRRNRVLLHRHKKLGVWIPVGGHIDENELPEEAALREIKEETGLSVRLHDPDPRLGIKDARQLVRPAHLLLEDIGPGHQHIDFIYFARSGTGDLRPSEGEARDLRWFTRGELERADIPDNVKKNALEALERLSPSS